MEFRSNCFLVKERKNANERDDDVNATSRKVNDSFVTVVSINARVYLHFLLISL